MKAISSVFKAVGLAPKAPPPPVIPEEAKEPPTIDKARAAVETRDEMLRKRGRRSSILTSETGLSDTGQVKRTTLLGN